VRESLSLKLPTVLVVWTLALACGKAGIRTPADTYLITKSGIADIQLEMTLQEAREAVPTAEFKRVSDGDGAALVLVTFASNASLTLWADEDDPRAPIDWSKHIKTIEAFGSAFHTREGIHPGTLVTDVEKVFGRTREIVKSEIESREYIAFEKQPDYLTFRLNHTGIFPERLRRTQAFQPGATIWSIAVSTYRSP
jgi:hypothetical protein